MLPKRFPSFKALLYFSLAEGTRKEAPKEAPLFNQL